METTRSCALSRGFRLFNLGAQRIITVEDGLNLALALIALGLRLCFILGSCGRPVEQIGQQKGCHGRYSKPVESSMSICPLTG
jgi:hypothetical protein